MGEVRCLWSLLVCCLTVTSFTGCATKTVTESSGATETATVTDSPVDYNEDATSNLGAWTRAMGGVLISLNEGNPYYFGGYKANDANREAAARILKSSWNITDKKSLKKQIRILLKTGSRKEYLEEAKEMNSLSAKERKKAFRQLSGDLEIHYKNVQYNWKTWGKKGLLAWDLCRISPLVQWAYVAGYLELDEAQSVMEPAVKKLQKNFTNWEDVVRNWLDGYALSESISLNSTEGTDYDKRWNIYLSLVDGQEQKGVLYDDSLFDAEIIPILSQEEK